MLGWGLYSSRLWFLIQVIESNSKQLQEQASTGFRYDGIHQPEDCLQELTTSSALFALLSLYQLHSQAASPKGGPATPGSHARDLEISVECLFPDNSSRTPGMHFPVLPLVTDGPALATGSPTEPRAELRGWDDPSRENWGPLTQAKILPGLSGGSS